jgi:hypothetical protein
MPKKKTPYCCPSCGYTTVQKGDMRKHLYTLLKPCPKTENNIELTNEIKEHILTNRVYNVPKPVTTNQTINNYINNHNTVNNFISNIDFMDKLSKYMSYNNLQLIDYGDTIKEKYSRTIHRLEKNMIRDYKLTFNELLDILDKVSSLCNGDYEQYNIHFDDKTKKLKFYEDGEWTSFLQDNGVSKLVAGIQEHFLDIYELYLVKKLYCKDNGAFYKQDVREHLTQYYNFLSCFNLDPYVKNKSNDYILLGQYDDEIDDEKDTVSNEMMAIYKKQVDTLTVQRQNKVRKDVCDIIKRNSKHNLDELNKRVASLFNMDETFKQQLLTS